MNIFAVDSNPEVAAAMLCLKHVCKMVLESAQMLAMPFDRSLLGLPYPDWNSSQFSHPCSIWTRQTYNNWVWLYHHGFALALRYERVYGKRHATRQHYDWFAGHSNMLPAVLQNLRTLTPHVQCMPSEYKAVGNSYLAYRHYYIAEKESFAKWETLAAIPAWWPTRTNRYVRIER